MRILILAVLMGGFFVPAFAGPTLEWRAMVNQPAHETRVGDKVARYLAEAAPGYEVGPVRLKVIVKAWGVNTWVPPEVRGHGWDKYENSDWSVEEWRISTTTKLEIGPPSFHFAAEYYMPLNRRDWHGGGMETDYYLLLGVGGRM